MPSVSSRMLLAFALIPAFILGCGGADGPELASVSGTVTLDGKPLPDVNIQFTPEKEGGSPSYGGTNAEGKYKLMFSQDRMGAMVGKHNVVIKAREPETDDDGKVSGPAPVKIPAKYGRPGKLSAEIKAGSQEVNFDLDSKDEPEPKPAPRPFEGRGC